MPGAPLLVCGGEVLRAHPSLRVLKAKLGIGDLGYCLLFLFYLSLALRGGGRWTWGEHPGCREAGCGRRCQPRSKCIKYVGKAVRHEIINVSEFENLFFIINIAVVLLSVSVNQSQVTIEL